MKFMHVADMHLDQSFEGLGKIPHDVATNLLKQNKLAMVKLIDEAIAQEVDFLLIVGDTFHQPKITIQTQNFFIQQLRRLEAHGIHVVLSFGNHDYYQAHRYWFEFPRNVYLFDAEEVQTITIATKDGQQVAISGFSYEHRWIENNMTKAYPHRKQDVDYHIGFFHGQIGDNPYASFSPTLANEKGYDYWALGHIHQPQVIQEQPLMIYPGSLIPHTQKDKDSGKYVLVESSSTGLSYEWHQVSEVKWLEQLVDTSSLENMQSLINRCRLLFNQQAEGYEFVSLKLDNMSEKFSALLEDPSQKKELLYILQKELFEASNGNTWLYALKTVPIYQPERFSLPLKEEKVDALLETYQEPEKFQELIGDLYKNAMSAQLVAIDESKQQQLIEQAKEQFSESFSLREGESS
ncbi:metallophosphoesterase family protein [Vagococcus xieshaowenii]|nr:DNA repair exonuclease [Vagococcus xieshaowenii]